MSLPTFFDSNLNHTSIQLVLSETELQHARAARRLTEGSDVCVLNGTGLKAFAKIQRLDRKQFIVDHLQITDSPEPPRKLVIAVAVPKTDRQRFLVESLTQLGVSRIVPLNGEFSAIKASDKNCAKWQRYAVEACKQSQNVWLPVIEPPHSITELTKAFSDSSNTQRMLADGKGESIDITMGRLGSKNILTTIVVIGPEGGLSDAELSLLGDSNYRPTRIGSSILRVETAAISFASAFAI